MLQILKQSIIFGKTHFELFRRSGIKIVLRQIKNQKAQISENIEDYKYDIFANIDKKYREMQVDRVISHVLKKIIPKNAQ